jgi:hypothetical protein
MAGVTGKTSGVGSDIIDYLDAVGENYSITLNVTSGKRSPEEQGEAMFDNWIKLKRGNVYSSSTLSSSDKKTLDEYYVTAMEDDKASSADKKKAETEFKKLATEKVGKKTKHASGRAVDVAQSSVSDKAYKAITLQMDEVPEGGRTDIYHFESTSAVPAVTDEIKAKWPK